MRTTFSPHCTVFLELTLECYWRSIHVHLKHGYNACCHGGNDLVKFTAGMHISLHTGSPIPIPAHAFNPQKAADAYVLILCDGTEYCHRFLCSTS